jgi:O-acetyl-ADP-ribose deacetylase (regulator of RNase III)
VAFPSISTGVYVYPVPLAARVALRAVIDAVSATPVAEVRFVLFSPADHDEYVKALGEIVPA